MSAVWKDGPRQAEYDQEDSGKSTPNTPWRPRGWTVAVGSLGAGTFSYELTLIASRQVASKDSDSGGRTRRRLLLPCQDTVVEERLGKVLLISPSGIVARIRITKKLSADGSYVDRWPGAYQAGRSYERSSRPAVSNRDTGGDIRGMSRATDFASKRERYP
jgi:hypothetical protein